MLAASKWQLTLQLKRITVFYATGKNTFPSPNLVPPTFDELAPLGAFYAYGHS